MATPSKDTTPKVADAAGSANAAASAVERAEALLAEQSEEELFASVPQPRRLPKPKPRAEAASVPADTAAEPVDAAEEPADTPAAPEVGADVAQTSAEGTPDTEPSIDAELPEMTPITVVSIDEARAAELQAGVIAAVREIFDPEIPVNIYDLGLIYSVEVDERARVAIQMTLTSPACPVAGTLPGEVEVKAASVAGVEAAWVDLVWDPPWGPDSMSEEAKLQLGFF